MIRVRTNLGPLLEKMGDGFRDAMEDRLAGSRTPPERSFRGQHPIRDASWLVGGRDLPHAKAEIAALLD